MLQSVTLAVLLLPAAGALLLGLTALRIPRVAVKVIGPGVVWVSFALVLVLFADSLSNGGKVLDYTYWTWLRSGSFYVPMNLQVDRLSIFMGLIITGVGGLIVTYAVGYMSHEGDASYARFFCYMDLFVLSMLLLVLAGNFVILACIELMLNAANLTLLTFAFQLHNLEGQLFALLVMVVAAAEAVVGLAVLVDIFRVRDVEDIDELSELKG